MQDTFDGRPYHQIEQIIDNFNQYTVNMVRYNTHYALGDYTVYWFKLNDVIDILNCEKSIIDAYVGKRRVRKMLCGTNIKYISEQGVDDLCSIPKKFLGRLNNLPEFKQWCEGINANKRMNELWTNSDTTTALKNAVRKRSPMKIVRV